jgi:hypothetical protein
VFIQDWLRGIHVTNMSREISLGIPVIAFIALCGFGRICVSSSEISLPDGTCGLFARTRQDVAEMLNFDSRMAPFDCEMLA